jgi:hypothetical protein
MGSLNRGVAMLTSDLAQPISKAAWVPAAISYYRIRIVSVDSVDYFHNTSQIYVSSHPTHVFVFIVTV